MKIEENYTLEFLPGGALIKNKWVYDHEKKEGQYIKEDITESGWLHERDASVYFHDGVTLDDVFKFVSTDSEIWDIILTNCFVRNYIEEWKNVDRTKINFSREYSIEEIEYLELYWDPEIFTFEGDTEIGGLQFPSFHGVGFEFKEDYTNEYMAYKKGDRINWALDFISLDKVLGIKVKLNPELDIIEEWTEDKNRDLNTLFKGSYKINLTQALQGIFWELSFHGSGKEKEEKKDMITAEYEELKAELGD